MRSKIHRYSVDYENEERWLNEMAAKGLALIHFSFITYVFEDTLPGEYLYRIELLEKLPSHPESSKYLSFLEENGIECVASWTRWVYLRKKAADGPFDLYSDLDSRLKHYNRILTLQGVLFLAFIPNFINMLGNGGRLPFLWPFVLLLGLVEAMLGWACLKNLRRRNRLKKERDLHE